MTLHQDSTKSAVFLVGGIGITPFLSMIAYTTEEKLPHKITLFFGNSSPKRATFSKELENFEKINPNFKCIFAYEHLTNKIIQPKHDSRYFIAGPPGFVAGVRSILDEAGINEDTIRTEEFSGY